MISTADFLAHVLPHEGWYVSTTFLADRYTGFNRFHATTVDLANYLLQTDSRIGVVAVYHAGSSFIQNKHDPKGTPRKDRVLGRTAANVRAARSFWLDIDCGEGKPYADARAGAGAVCEFARRVKLPPPLYVASGSGVHVYWTLEEDIDPQTWQRYALGLKALCHRHDLAAGPERTADIASILRPVGTHWRKRGEVEVRCGPLAGPYPLAAFEAFLHAAPATDRAPVGARPRIAGALADLFDASDTHAETIAAACPQLRALRDTKGRLAEPLWYACLGVLGYCSDAQHFAHEWSSGYDGYTYEETQERLERVKTLSGATTCAYFHSLNPKTCEACPHFGKIKSPISLGRAERSVGTVSAESGKNIFGELLKAETGQARTIDLPDLPHDFFWRNDGALITRSENARGGVVDIVVSRYPIYLDSVQIGEVRGQFNLLFKQRLPDRGYIDISLPSRDVFSSQSTSVFAERGANIHEHQWFLKYVRAAIDLHYGAAKLNTRYDQFGWKDDDHSFLFGLDLYNGVGVKRIIGSDELQIRCREDWVGPSRGGTLDGWRQAINALFAAGCEPQSVALLGAFAAPLMRFQERDEGGAIIHLVTRESGTGKSTALIGAASVWGRREGLGLTNDDTRISKALTLGALGNLPVIYDEIALRDPEAIRSFIINFTNGRDKMRATRAGEIKHTASTWQTLLISAANTSLSEMLSIQNTPEAPAYRVMEFALEIPEGLRHAQGDRLRRLLRANSGHAGKAYLEWLVRPENLAWTRTKLETVTQQVWEKTKFGPEYRFWVRTIAAIAVAGIIVKRLDLVDFSIDRIMMWLFENIGIGVESRKDREWTLPALAEFLLESVSNTLVMPAPFVQGRKQMPIHMPSHRLTVRSEISSHRYLIAISALRDWMAKRELNYREWVRSLEDRKIIMRSRILATLAAGTDIPGAQVWCVEINSAHPAIAGQLPMLVVDNASPPSHQPTTSAVAVPRTE